MKKSKILMAGIAALSVAACVMPAGAAASSHFSYSISVPGEKTQTFDSREGNLLITNMKEHVGNIRFKVKTVVISGKKVKPSDVRLSYDYVENSDHIASLTNGGSSLTIRSDILKAIAGGKKNGALTIRRKTAIPESAGDVSMRVKDMKFKKTSPLNSVVNINYGRYGTVSRGFEVQQGSFKINGKKKSRGHYAWWMAEYRFTSGKWKAREFIVVPNAPYGPGSTAYRFQVLRKDKHIEGMKFKGALIRTGDSAETWAREPSAVYPKGWSKDKVFRYTYVLPKVKGLKVSSPKKGQLTARWSRSSEAQAYRIACSRKKDFKPARAQKAGGPSARITALHSKQKYYVRVRSQRTIDGKIYWSPWSDVKTLKVR